MSNTKTLPTVLVIDDEIEIRRFLNSSLKSNGYIVYEAATGQDGLQQIGLLRPDIIILDLGLPDIDGLNILKQLREWNHVPVIALSARTGDNDKIQLLDAGADDYLTKPFSLGELLARIRAAQRHVQPTPEVATFAAGSLKIDFTRRLVTIKDEAVKLSKTEYALLRILAENAGKVMTHRQLLKEAWGPEYVNETQYLRVYMAQLRKKIESDPNDPQLVITEPGVGYRLSDG